MDNTTFLTLIGTYTSDKGSITFTPIQDGVNNKLGIDLTILHNDMPQGHEDFILQISFGSHQFQIQNCAGTYDVNCQTNLQDLKITSTGGNIQISGIFTTGGLLPLWTDLASFATIGISFSNVNGYFPSTPFNVSKTVSLELLDANCPYLDIWYDQSGFANATWCNKTASHPSNSVTFPLPQNFNTKQSFQIKFNSIALGPNNSATVNVHQYEWDNSFFNLETTVGIGGNWKEFSLSGAECRPSTVGVNKSPVFVCIFGTLNKQTPKQPPYFDILSFNWSY